MEWNSVLDSLPNDGEFVYCIFAYEDQYCKGGYCIDEGTALFSAGTSDAPYTFEIYMEGYNPFLVYATHWFRFPDAVPRDEVLAVYRQIIALINPPPTS